MLFYLATPYTKYPHGIEQAFIDACKLAARLLNEKKFSVYSPIAHTHPIAIHGNIDPYELSIWLPFDANMIRVCNSLLVAHMDGWEQSSGIAHEVDEFSRARKPILDLDPKTLATTLRPGPIIGAM